jgi:hypothetical protein
MTTGVVDLTPAAKRPRPAPQNVPSHASVLELLQDLRRTALKLQDDVSKAERDATAHKKRARGLLDDALWGAHEHILARGSEVAVRDVVQLQMRLRMVSRATQSSSHQ